MNKSLQTAMRRVDAQEIEGLEEAIEQAMQSTHNRPPVSIEEERQRMLDSALADAIEIVNRQRNRLSRRVCSTGDGRATRQIFELLRGMADGTGGSDNDPSFQ